MMCFDIEQAARDLHFVPVRLVEGDPAKPIFGPLFEREDDAREWCESVNFCLSHTAHRYQVAQVTHTVRLECKDRG